MKHKGEIFKNAIYKYCNDKGISLTALAKKAGYNQATIYRHFERDDLPNHIIIRWGKAMKYDFLVEFPDLADDLIHFHTTPNKNSDLEINTREELVQKIEYWKEKYIDLLERYNKLLVEKFQN